MYEDPWLAGGHNGLSNGEDPERPEAPLPRVLELRQHDAAFGLGDTPIIMAGGVWWLDEWEDWIDNPDLGPIAFQFGTRPLLTRESPIRGAWKQRLMALQAGRRLPQQVQPDRLLLARGQQRLHRGAAGARRTAGGLQPGAGRRAHGAVRHRRPQRLVFLTRPDLERARGWEAAGFTEAMRTPDSTLVFVTPRAAAQINADQTACMGCLRTCRFSNWSQHGPGLQQRQEGRSALVLHPEDAASDQPCRRRPISTPPSAT